MNKNLLPYDVYERHRKIGSYIKNDESVLDVGGALDHLSQFTKNNQIVTANLSSGENANVIIKGDKLPFKANSFTTVCSIDVLEHIKKDQRQDFINDLLRVAQKRVILSFPIGTPQHNRYEKNILNWLKSKGHDVAYLEEHIKNSLPQVDEIEIYTKGRKKTLNFSGNINLNNYLFKLYLYDPKIKYLRKIIYYSKLFINLLTNPLLYKILSKAKFSGKVNRAYLIINK